MPERRPITDDPGGFVFLHALNAAIGRTPLWITASLLTTLLALVVSLPWFGFFQDAMDHRYEPGSLVAALDETFRFDHRAARAVLNEGTRSTAAMAALIAMLVGVFTAGGWLQVFLERTGGQSLRRFFFGGSRYFFRFFRVLLLTLLTLHLVGFVVYGAPWELLVHDLLLGVEDGNLDELASELSARQVVFVQDGLYVLLVALVLVWGDYTRTRLALHGTSSAVWAGLCTWTTILLHPLRTLRPIALLWATEALVLGLAWFLSRKLQAALGADPGWVPLLLLVILGQLILFWRTIVRGARYSAAVQISHNLIRPLPRPDPWKQTVGGPGGPRYPIDDDEYGVAL
jgi:hypothetical protein